MANMIGTEPNQVPTNADLGNSAYMNLEEIIKEIEAKYEQRIADLESQIADHEARIVALEP